MPDIDPTRTDLAREFRRVPYGRHSPELQRILNLMRSRPLAGNYCVVCRVPHREWVLARFRETSREAPEVIGPSFSRLADAEWHVFKLRWRDITGEELSEDLELAVE